jgi:hypothetical protein
VTAEHWMAEPEAEDYPAAQSYLSLLVGKAEAAKLVKALRSQKTLRYYAAMDMLRASGLPLLPTDDPEVATDLKKVRAGTKLSPVLLVLGNPLWVADGYHRICSSYHIGEKTEIPCRAVKRKS